MTNDNEERIQFLEKEVELLKQILTLEENIQILRRKPQVQIQHTTAPWITEPIRFKD